MGELVSKCPVCGGGLEVKEVEKVVIASFQEERCSNRSLDGSRKPETAGSDAAILIVEAGVCHRCGERVYSKETHELIQRVRKSLREGDRKDLEKVGDTYRYRAPA